MKKVILTLAVLSTIALSCKKVDDTSTEVTTDSTEVVVDSVSVDSVKVDSVEVK
jgi:hypothetical protein